MSLRGEAQPRGKVASPVSSEGSERRSLRGDIEGLRAVAVLMVLLYHAGAPFFPGGFVGVDVFFVISGFLITALLVKELAATGTISLPGFYARRAKRLLPAAAVVLIFAAVGSALFLPPTRWASTAWDVVVSSFYGINWRLASASIDYLASAEAPSPVQHFWSLAVEEQYYLVWPLLLLLATRWARPLYTGQRRGSLTTQLSRAERPLTPSLLLGLLVVAVPSLAWSVHLTSSDPGPAYFVTTTRMWELAIGGGVAIVAAHLPRIPRRVATALGWSGLAAVLGTPLVLTTATPFPGLVALIPTLGTAAVIAAGPAAGQSGPVRLLGVALMRWIGGLSYSLYLWHWPLIVMATAMLGGEPSFAQGLAVVLASFVPAYLSFRFVEEPVRRARPLAVKPKLALRLGLACTLAGALGGLGLLIPIWLTPAPATATTALLPAGDSGRPAAAPKFGAGVLWARPLGDPGGMAVDEVSSITPDILLAKKDYLHDCAMTGFATADVTTCTFGRSSRPYILVLGDSHAAQWMPAMKVIAESERYRVASHVKSSCPFVKAEVARGTRTYSTCNEWNRKVRQTLAREPRPDLVILTHQKFQLVEGGRVLTGGENAQKATDAMRAAIREFTDRGIHVAVIRDTPAPKVNVPDCVASHTDNLTRCTTPRSEALRGSEQLAAASGVKNAHTIDLTDAVCPHDPCAAVIGGVMVWRDANHLTRTYVESLTPRLKVELQTLMKRAEKDR